MESYIIGAARTPRGKGKIGKGALTGVHPQELLATVLRALPSQSGFDEKDVDDVVVGAVSQVVNRARTSRAIRSWRQDGRKKSAACP